MLRIFPYQVFIQIAQTSTISQRDLRKNEYNSAASIAYDKQVRDQERLQRKVEKKFLKALQIQRQLEDNLKNDNSQEAQVG